MSNYYCPHCEHVVGGLAVTPKARHSKAAAGCGCVVRPMLRVRVVHAISGVEVRAWEFEAVDEDDVEDQTTKLIHGEMWRLGSTLTITQLKQ